MSVSRLLPAALSAAFTFGCAHGEGATAPAKEPDDAEVTVLRERVSRLERRLSDLDAQMALLSDKVAAAPRDSVSIGGGYEPSYASASSGYAPAPVASSPSSWNDYRPTAPTAEDERAWQSDPATRSIDLGPAPPRFQPVELPPEPVEPVEPAPEPAPADVGDGAVSFESQGPPRGDAQTVYDWAHARMKEGRYLEAIAAFEDVLERHGQHHLADNALYWTGECHLERGEPRLAIDTWKTLPLRFPASAKMADSLYGMALAHEELGEPVLAETLYGQLLQQYPKAEKRGEAKNALKRLRGSPDAPR